MTKQRPTADRITNELAGASAFFKRPATPPAEPDSAPAPVASAIAPGPTPPPPAPEPSTLTPVTVTRTPRTPVRPVRRQMIRHPFELYMDQLDSLRALAESQRRQGQPASMSRMVRDAIDRYLDEHPTDDQ